MAEIENGTHIRFIPAPPKAKTLVWWVCSRYDETQLGWIAWFPRWRKYAFFVKPDTVYEQVCLREIASFCERKTFGHKSASCSGTPEREATNGGPGERVPPAAGAPGEALAKTGGA